MRKLSPRQIVILFATLAFSTLIFFLAPKGILQKGPAPEIAKILELKSTSEQSRELLKLLERVGPIEAQEEMLHSGLPFTGQTHLLIHTVGDYVYEQYGMEGLAYCKDYFLSACYHAVILNTLGDNGIDGVAEAMAVCEKGGPGVKAQCAHGAGHGFVAWHNYDLLKAAQMCDELGEKTVNFSYFNCYDGVFMENIWGVHNGKPSEKRWIKQDDLYYPCNDARIPEKYLNGCWSNQATRIYQYYHGDLKKTALACDAVTNPQYQETCYNNFSRQIHPLTKGQVEKVLSLCANATGEKWQNYCILTNVTAYWSVGDKETPGKICSALNRPVREECWERIEKLGGKKTEVDEYRALEARSEKDGAKSAWLYLLKTYKTPYGVVGNPHNLAHLVGRLIYKEYGLEGVTICTPDFAFGCYHGLMEPALEGASAKNYQKNLLATEEACDKVGPATLSSCIHGLGHGVATYREYDLKPALTDCDILDERMRTYCYDGVFMEFSISTVPSYYKKNDPLYPCNAIAEKYHTACARAQSRIMRDHFGLTTREIAKTCKASDSKTIHYNCIDSLGYFAAQIALEEPEKIVAFCEEIGNEDDEAQCKAAAAGELVFQDARGWEDNSMRVCQSMEANYLSACNNRIALIKKSYGR